MSVLTAVTYRGYALIIRIQVNLFSHELLLIIKVYLFNSYFFHDLMTNKKVPFLLILIMLIAPIASAFGHCSEMGELGHFSKNIVSTNTTLPGIKNHLNHKKKLEGQQDKLVNIDCHTSNSCTLHPCVGYGLTSSSPTISCLLSSYFSSDEYSSRYNTILSSNLRPPISIL